MAVLLVGVAVAGCTDTQPGQAVAGTPSAAPGGGVKTSVAVPPRPKELKLDGVDPCKLFTKDQLTQLRVTRQRNESKADEPFKGTQICVMEGGDGKTFWTFETLTITTEGIGPWLGGGRNVDAKLVNVSGFPAASYKLLGTTTFDCNTAVDVADGQQLSLEFRPDTRGVFSQNDMCQKSEQAAGFALQTLQTLK